MKILIAITQSAPMLEHYARVLEELGLRKKYLYSDIVDTIRVESDFVNEVNSLFSEIAFGDYITHIDRDGVLDLVQREDMALVVKQTAHELFRVVSERGFYNKEGIFPYEFVEYRGGVFHLR